MQFCFAILRCVCLYVCVDVLITTKNVNKLSKIEGWELTFHLSETYFRFHSVEFKQFFNDWQVSIIERQVIRFSGHSYFILNNNFKDDLRNFSHYLPLGVCVFVCVCVCVCVYLSRLCLCVSAHKCKHVNGCLGKQILELSFFSFSSVMLLWNCCATSFIRPGQLSVVRSSAK